MARGKTPENIVEHAVEFEVFRHRNAQAFAGLGGFAKRRAHVHDIHDGHNNGEQNREPDEAHARRQANGHRQKHAADVFRRSRNAAEADEIEHAHNCDASAQIAVYKGYDHLHDEWQKRKRDNKVLRIVVPEHVNGRTCRAEHNRCRAAHQELGRRNARHGGISRSEQRRGYKVEHEKTPLEETG